MSENESVIQVSEDLTATVMEYDLDPGHHYVILSSETTSNEVWVDFNEIADLIVVLQKIQYLYPR